MIALIKRHRKIAVVTAVVAVLAVAGGLAYKHYHQPTPVPAISNSINYKPPTAAQKADGESHKTTSTDQSSQTPTTSSGKKAVTVVVTNATATSVNAYVSGVVEDSGTCTATFTKGSQSFTKTSAGFANVSTTNCTPINITSGDFPSTGSWSVTVSYSSTTASGTSQATTIEVN